MRTLEAERRLRVNLQQELTHYYSEHSRDRVAIEDLRRYAEQAVGQVKQLSERNETLQLALARLAAAQVPCAIIILFITIRVEVSCPLKGHPPFEELRPGIHL